MPFFWSEVIVAKGRLFYTIRERQSKLKYGNLTCFCDLDLMKQAWLL